MQLKKTVLSLSEQLSLNRIFRRFNRNKTLVLNYHGVVPDDYHIDAWTLIKERQFRKQMTYLTKYYKVISINEAINHIDHRSIDGKPKAIITFDDGYSNNYSVAYPILKEFNIPATIFVTTAFIDSVELFWFDKVIYAIQSSQCQVVDLNDHNLGIHYFSSANRSKRWVKIQCLLSKLKAKKAGQRGEIVEKIVSQLCPNFENASMIYPLKSNQIIEMSHNELIEFGSHTHRHEILTQLKPIHATETIQSSLNAIYRLTGRTVNYFSYPDGAINKNILEVLQKFQILAAFTTRNSFWDRRCSPYEIPRLKVGAYDSVDMYAAVLSGLNQFLIETKTLF